jgi:hypothetical protein
MDTTVVPVRKACVAMMKRGVRQQRYKLKKKYFNLYPLHLVLKTSPVHCMTNGQWIRLVEHWKDENKMVSFWQWFSFLVYHVDHIGA